MVKTDSKPACCRAKGAQTRHVVPFGFELAIEMYEAEQSPHVCGELRAFLISNSICVWNTYAEHVCNCTNTLLLLDATLSKEAVATDTKLCRMTPKFHLLAELA